jgi:hypothetical protein
MIDRFQGDPRLVLTENGAKIIFTGGQPVMDQGVENQALIALFTTQGWPGNTLFTNPDQKIGSDFVEASRQAITMTSLNNIRDAALKALLAPIFGDIEVEVTNPTSYQIKTEIILKPPGEDPQTIILLKNGINWVLQGTNPASERTGGV